MAGRREQRRREFDIEIVVLAERHVELGIGRARLGERRRDLARRHPPVHHGALRRGARPRTCSLKLSTSRAGAGSRTVRAGDARRSTSRAVVEDGGAHGARADGRTGDEVGRQRVGAAAQRPAGLAGKKGVELRAGASGRRTIWGSLWNTTLAPVMRPPRSTPAITSNGVVE